MPPICTSPVGPLLCSLALLFSFPAFTQSETYAPIYLDGTKTISFESDLRLTPSIETSIDVWVAAPLPFNSADGLGAVVLSCGDVGQDGRYQIRISEDRMSISLFVLLDGKLGIEENVVAKCDFRDGQFHHFTAIIDGFIGSAYLDGVPVKETIVFEGGNSETRLSKQRLIRGLPKPVGMPLYLGGDGQQSTFKGWIYTARIWDEALKEDKIKQLMDLYGLPASPLSDHLVAYSHFTNQRQSLFYTQSQLYVDMVGNTDSSTFMIRNPPPFQKGYQISALYINPVLNPSPSLRIGEFMVEARNPDGVTSVVSNRIGLFTFFAWEALRAQGGDKSSLDNLIFSQLGFHPDSTTNQLHDIEEIGKARMRHKQFKTLTLQPNQEIIGIAGSRDAKHIWTLRFLLRTGNVETWTDIFGFRPGDRGPELFYIKLPQYAHYEGLTGSADEQGLHAIGLVYSFPKFDAIDPVLFQVTQGTWVERDGKEPFRFAWSLEDGRHGNYSTRAVYRILELPGSDDIFLLSETKGLSPRGLRFSRNPIPNSYHRVLDKGAPISLDGRTFIYDDFPEGNVSLYITPNEVRLNSAKVPGLPSFLTRPSEYEEGSSDKIPWGGTFSLDRRPTLALSNFKGYNIFKMSTHDYQSNTGSSKLLFKYPKEDSQDYWTTDNKVIVPHGLFYNNDNGGSDKGVTTTVESEDSYRTLWGFSLGAEIGIPKIASFSVNSKFENEVEESSKISLTRSIARTIETRYAMVVDKARLDLSDEFRERIEELRRQHVLGYEPNFSAFMSAFGTHYPYAVTYGGLAYLELFGSSQSSSLSQRDKLELEIKANALIDVLSVGVSGGGNYEQAQKNQRAIKEEKFKFGTMGGSISRGQGWTLPRGEEVPIFLDLRPLYELFSPLYFDDPVIWGDLRVGLSVTFNNYINMVEEEAAFDALEQLHGDTRQQNWSDALEKFLILYPKSQHLVIIRDNYIQKDPILQAKFLQKIEALIKQLDKK